MKYRKHAHCIYGLEYHIVMVTKDRRPVIDDEISEFIKKEVAGLMPKLDGHLIEIETDEDHIHILAEFSPSIALREVVRTIKTVTSRRVRKVYGKKIEPQLCGDNFWSDSYFITSTGDVTLDILKKYVENQGKPKKRGRPFANSSPLE